MTRSNLTRREATQALLGWGLLGGGLVGSSTAQAHQLAGRVVPPQRPPSLPLQMTDGRRLDVSAVLAGQVTAVQMMFTTCSATCPIQGALFAAVRDGLGAAWPQARLLSLSLDPLTDTPQSLAAWLGRFGQAGTRWQAARPAIEALPKWVDFLKSGQSGPDRHTGQVYVFDKQGRLAMRTVDFPPAEQVVGMLTGLIKLSP
ncbi:MAG: SCO family protein [Aquabacterium sp.]|nr:SCO family protein [Aquabacterium sp.]